MVSADKDGDRKEISALCILPAVGASWAEECHIPVYADSRPQKGHREVILHVSILVHPDVRGDGDHDADCKKIDCWRVLDLGNGETRMRRWLRYLL